MLEKLQKQKQAYIQVAFLQPEENIIIYLLLL